MVGRCVDGEQELSYLMGNQHEVLEDLPHVIEAVRFIQKIGAMNAVVEDIMHVIVDAMDAVADDADHDRIVDQEVVRVIIPDHEADRDHGQGRVLVQGVVRNHVLAILVVREILEQVDTPEIVVRMLEVHRHENVHVLNLFVVRNQRIPEDHRHRIDRSLELQSDLKVMVGVLVKHLSAPSANLILDHVLDQFQKQDLGHDHTLDLSRMVTVTINFTLTSKIIL